MAIRTPMRTEERRSLRELSAHHYYIPASLRAFQILRLGFCVAPIIAGIDKFFNFLVTWEKYLAPQATAVTGLAATPFMRVAGVIEIFAGLLVAFKPRIGGIVVGFWLIGIIANLLLIPGYYDVALRDLGLCLGAFALSLLAVEFQYYRKPYKKLGF